MNVITFFTNLPLRKTLIFIYFSYLKFRNQKKVIDSRKDLSFNSKRLKALEQSQNSILQQNDRGG